MTNLQIRKSYDKITPSSQAAEDMWQRIMDSSEDVPHQSHSHVKSGRNGKMLRRTLLIAAVIASLMTVTAVAAEFYGIKTVAKKETQMLLATVQPDGSVESTMTPGD